MRLHVALERGVVGFCRATERHLLGGEQAHQLLAGEREVSGRARVVAKDGAVHRRFSGS